MNIREFLTESLVQIADGVREANARLLPSRPNDETINPFSLSPGQLPGEGRGIEFDVAVVAKQEMGSEVSATGGLLAVLGVNASGNLDAKNETVSRVRFRVSVDQWIR